MPSAAEILDAAMRSAAELRLHNRKPVRIRIHPLDAETIIAAYMPEMALEELRSLMGLEVELDEAARLGEPVAEWEPHA